MDSLPDLDRVLRQDETTGLESIYHHHKNKRQALVSPEWDLDRELEGYFHEGGVGIRTYYLGRDTAARREAEMDDGEDVSDEPWWKQI